MQALASSADASARELCAQPSLSSQRAPDALVLVRQLEEELMAQANDAGSLLMRGKHTAKTMHVRSILSAPGGGAVVLASASHSASALHSPLAPLGMVYLAGVLQVRVCTSGGAPCMGVSSGNKTDTSNSADRVRV